MCLAPPCRPGAKGRTKEITPQYAQQGDELLCFRFVTPMSGGEWFHGLASDAELDCAEMPADAGDVESNVHRVVLIGVGRRRLKEPMVGREGGIKVSDYLARMDQAGSGGQDRWVTVIREADGGHDRALAGLRDRCRLLRAPGFSPAAAVYR